MERGVEHHIDADLEKGVCGGARRISYVAGYKGVLSCAHVPSES